MKHFFINFLLDIFFILPNWALKVLTLRKEITYKNEVFDYQSMIYISLISWFITKFGFALDMSEFSDEMRKKMANLRIKINNNVALKKIIHKEDLIIDQKNNLVLRQYSLDSQISDKCVLFFHGGGYAISDIDVYDPVVSFMCEELNTKIFSLEYSLSPENKFPQALKEANIAFEWLRSHGYNKEQITKDQRTNVTYVPGIEASPPGIWHAVGLKARRIYIHTSELDLASTNIKAPRD